MATLGRKEGDVRGRVSVGATPTIVAVTIRLVYGTVTVAVGGRAGGVRHLVQLSD